jgi:hypothetical protein
VLHSGGTRAVEGRLRLAERLITECRKNGRLPLNFWRDDDSSRDFRNIEHLHDPDPDLQAQRVMDYVERAHKTYEPVSFWDYQNSYVQLLVEKVGLKNLFDPVLREILCASRQFSRLPIDLAARQNPGAFLPSGRPRARIASCCTARSGHSWPAHFEIIARQL